MCGYTNEEWRPIKDWEGYYEVSSEGRVRSLSRTIYNSGVAKKLKMRYLQLTTNAYGYATVGLNKDGVTITKVVHRLVAEAFLPNPDNLPEVDHINGTRNDNRVSNLRWVSRTENVHNRVFDGSREIKKQQEENFYKPDADGEVWRPVVGYEEYYEVSSLGNVRSLTRHITTKNGVNRTIRGKSLSTKPDKWGYSSVTLCANSIRVDVSVHRLVAEAFIPNPKNYHLVRHINGIESDNRVENLVWTPFSMTHRVRNISIIENLPNEEWRDIKGYEGLYQISSCGRVKSYPNPKKGYGWRLLKQNLNNGGYFYVTLHKEKKTQKFTVHRLVAINFLNNPDNLPVVNHKDECKTNNNVSNLEWCTYQYNNTYGTCKERALKNRDNKAIAMKVASTAGHKAMIARKSKPVVQLSEDGTVINHWPSISAASRGTGIPITTMRTACHRNGKDGSELVRGYIWRFEERAIDEAA